MRLTFAKETKNQLVKFLEKAAKYNIFKTFRIAKSLLLVEARWCILDIADLFHVSEGAVCNWVKRFMAGRFAWLYGLHRKRRGPKPKITIKQKKQLYDIVLGGPEAYGFDCGVWNSPMIAEIIHREFGVLYNPRYLCRLLMKIGLSFQKAAFEPDRTEANVKERK